MFAWNCFACFGSWCRVAFPSGKKDWTTRDIFRANSHGRTGNFRWFHGPFKSLSFPSLTHYLSIVPRMHHGISSEQARTVVLFVDGFDVLFQTGSEEILQRFQQTQQKLLFAGDHSCFPFKYWPDNAAGIGKWTNHSAVMILQNSKSFSLFLTLSFTHWLCVQGNGWVPAPVLVPIPVMYATPCSPIHPSIPTSMIRPIDGWIQEGL